jgi:zona occludens toxin (predicted ATPase)
MSPLTFILENSLMRLKFLLPLTAVFTVLILSSAALHAAPATMNPANATGQAASHHSSQQAAQAAASQQAAQAAASQRSSQQAAQAAHNAQAAAIQAMAKSSAAAKKANSGR